MFLPDYWPAYYSKSKGCEVWDLDGKHYLDFSYMGIGSCIIGYADEDVNSAVKLAIDSGSMNTLNAPEEVKLAELLLEIHEWADMVRYTRTGGEAMAVAVRIARAYSKKDIVLFCGYHGWHDWYLSSNLNNDSSLDGHLLPGLQPTGVPRSLNGVSIPFSYNNIEEFLTKFEKNRDSVGAIVLETIRDKEPEKDFIASIKEISKKSNIPFIVDEITSGWRLNTGGAHLLFDIEPDIAVFAKGLSNGFPMAAIIGKKSIMQASQDSFISSTYWTDRIGPAASIATIEKMKENNIPKHLNNAGKSVKEIWKNAAIKHNIKIHISGINPIAHFEFEYNNSLEIKTLFTQLMLERGFLANTAFYASFAHTQTKIEKYENSVNEVFSLLSSAIDLSKVKQLLNGPVCHTGFKRLN
ncbi:MAG: aminotransferase class III-fold pyridoxal phosphate-dependent enzyme [Flavobacteriaceae bacterium]|nr:aminotransferase class III-fold pyridoxal phosphate-dependent enzyme [Flavobacteriaceae bacterium]